MGRREEEDRVTRTLTIKCSYGIIMCEIASRKDPYEGMSPEAVAVAVVRDKSRPNVPEDVMLEEYTEYATQPIRNTTSSSNVFLSTTG